jgi:hypothetical protein
MRILYKFASRSRPYKFFDCVNKIRELSTHKDYFIWGTFDCDDDSMNNGVVLSRLKEYPEVRGWYGTSTGKINAINRDMDLIDQQGHHWDICIVWSDDMQPLVKGFDSIIEDKMKEHWPDTDGVLHFPDSHAKHELITLSILGRKYYERDYWLYNPEYDSVSADNEFTWMAIIRNRHAFISMKIFDHFHPAWGMAPMDDQYRKTENPVTYAKDGLTFAKRKAINFGLYTL